MLSSVYFDAGKLAIAPERRGVEMMVGGKQRACKGGGEEAEGGEVQQQRARHKGRKGGKGRKTGKARNTVKHQVMNALVKCCSMKGRTAGVNATKRTVLANSVEQGTAAEKDQRKEAVRVTRVVGGVTSAQTQSGPFLVVAAVYFLSRPQ